MSTIKYTVKGLKLQIKWLYKTSGILLSYDEHLSWPRILTYALILGGIHYSQQGEHEIRAAPSLK